MIVMICQNIKDSLQSVQIYFKMSASRAASGEKGDIYSHSVKSVSRARSLIYFNEIYECRFCAFSVAGRRERRLLSGCDPPRPAGALDDNPRSTPHGGAERRAADTTAPAPDGARHPTSCSGEYRRIQ